MLLVYFILRPVLKFLFPQSAANGGQTGKGAAGVGCGTAHGKDPQTAEGFLKQRLDVARKRKAAPGPAGQPGWTQRRGRTSSGSWPAELTLPLPPVAVAEGQLSSQQAQALCSRLHVDSSSVVTIAFPAAADCSATGIHDLLRTLAGQMHVFVLIKLQPAVEGNDDYAQNERKRVEQSFLPLTSGATPVIPAQRLLFSQSVAGRTAAVRQLQSSIHVDFDHNVCRILEQHVRSIIYVKLDAAPTAGAGAGAAGFSEDGLIMIRNYAQLHELQL